MLLRHWPLIFKLLLIAAIGLGGGTMFATPAFDGRQILAGAMDGRLISLTVRAGGGPSR